MTIERARLEIHGDVPGVASELQDPSTDTDPPEILDSWHRSAENYHVNRLSRSAPHILTSAELNSAREPVARLVLSAQTELDGLYRVVRQAGYVMLLCDTNGVAVEHRGRDERSAEFRHWGTWVGGVWAEAVEGTNGIGTCIAECRPITVHQSQHFRARHGTLSCSGAPVFGADGRLAAVLDVSSIDPTLSARSHGLTLPLVVASARAIEERLFREAFPRAWILAIAPSTDDEPAPLLAIDRDQVIVGADRAARAVFGITQEQLDAGPSLWALFARTGPLLQRRGDGADTLVQLKEINGAETRCAVVSAPVLSLRSQISPGDAALWMRPRSALLQEFARRFAVQPPRGGLAAGALRRVCEHVASHLDESVALEVLAAEAHLSVYHFARAFRQSMGVSPHRYILEQRVKRAQQMLRQTDLPLATLASAVGFSDQAHFSRYFHRLVGVTPSSYRRTERD